MRSTATLLAVWLLLLFGFAAISKGQDVEGNLVLRQVYSVPSGRFVIEEYSYIVVRRTVPVQTQEPVQYATPTYYQPPREVRRNVVPTIVPTYVRTAEPVNTTCGTLTRTEPIRINAHLAGPLGAIRAGASLQIGGCPNGNCQSVPAYQR